MPRPRVKSKKVHRDFKTLVAFLTRVPAMQVGRGRGSISCGRCDDGRWWVKFALDIQHPKAWHVVQELGHVLNSISLEDRLPTVFMPVSPPPYLNGGPGDYLSWVIECHDVEFTPADCAKVLQGRLPRPVEDLKLWETDDDKDGSDAE
jgi:hypothetical protein